MSASNPFQVPSCFQIDHERRRRERFKRTFIAVVATSILLLVGLLIEGCMSEHARAAASTSIAADLPEPAPDAPMVAAEQVSVPIPLQNPQPVVSQSTAAVSKMNIPSAGHPETVYVVKSGDTLTHIARTHRITVKTILAVNSLSSDHISVGTKLKLPEI